MTTTPDEEYTPETLRRALLDADEDLFFDTWKRALREGANDWERAIFRDVATERDRIKQALAERDALRASAALRGQIFYEH